MGIHLNNSTIASLAASFGCMVGTLPLTYLGLLLNAKPFTYAFWEEKVERCLKSRNENYISKGGRLTFDQSHSQSAYIFPLSLRYLQICVLTESRSFAGTSFVTGIKIKEVSTKSNDGKYKFQHLKEASASLN